MFFEPKTRALFAREHSLTEIGRRVLGEREAQFRPRPGCPALLVSDDSRPDDWQRFVARLLHEPAFRDLRDALATRLGLYFTQGSRAGRSLLQVDFNSASNVVVFERNRQEFLLARELPAGELGWYGPSDALWDWQGGVEQDFDPPPAVPPLGAGVEAGVAAFHEAELRDELAHYARAAEEFNLDLSNRERWIDFFRAHRRFVLRVKAVLAHEIEGVRALGLRHAEYLLRESPETVDPARFFPVRDGDELDIGLRAYRNSRGILRAALAEAGQPLPQ